MEPRPASELDEIVRGLAVKLNLPSQDGDYTGGTFAFGPGGQICSLWFGSGPDGCSGSFPDALSMSVDFDADIRPAQLEQVNDIVNELVGAGMFLAHYEIPRPWNHHESCPYAEASRLLVFYFDPHNDKHVELVREHICDKRRNHADRNRN